MEIKPCPFCGHEVYMDKIPLWNGSHGYHGCYEFKIRCKNIDCGCRFDFWENDTVYRDEETAIYNVIEQWNRRAYGN